ncbi:hypothetical protein V8B97DRAFT_2023342 [Scleroderma yunnanense]
MFDIKKAEIVIKQPYIDHNVAKPEPPFMQLTLKEEFRRLYCEANVLYWAKALLKMMYNYIDSSMNEADKPPFEIPHLCFIDTGLLLVYSNRPNTSKGPGNTQTGMVSTVYLAEELIPLSNDVDFMKYIHNGNAASCWLANATANEIMEFLAFTQHVQYFKTGSQVYISDYQESLSLLTEPQILTHL